MRPNASPTTPPEADNAMTTPIAKPAAPTPPPSGRFRLPDIPEREPDEVTQFDRLFKTGNAHYLALHLGRPETTLVEADRWIVPDAFFDKRRARYPDLMVAFDVSPQDYKDSNGFIVSEQGKPPDFVLEVASPSTAQRDLNEKRDFYESIGVLEYWLFDATGEYYRTRLAGFRLADEAYVPIDVADLPGGDLQGYSVALNLNLRSAGEELEFCDPETGRRIATFEDERTRADAAENRADAAENRADAAENRADTAENRADTAENRADTAEARVRELEAELRNLRDPSA